jgi:hypothetical protein
VNLATAQHLLKPFFGVKFLYDYGLLVEKAQRGGRALYTVIFVVDIYAAALAGCNRLC